MSSMKDLSTVPKISSSKINGGFESLDILPRTTRNANAACVVSRPDAADNLVVFPSL